MDAAPVVLVCGTGAFAARIVFDIAATAAKPVRVVVAGRNRDRLAWLKTAANARAAIFRRPAVFAAEPADLADDGAATALLAATRPGVVVQAASVQPSSVIAGRSDAWGRLVAEGGLSATAVFQAVITARVARAVRSLGLEAPLINCCFADVVNGIISAMDLPVTCGMGNVAILSNAFAGMAAIAESRIKVLAHYQTIGPWRRPVAERSGPVPRVWIDGTEVADVLARFADVQLTPEPVIDISGASGVPLILALAGKEDWTGHVPGPNGLPGGYPVALGGGRLRIDLPGVPDSEAVAWNARFEERNGLVVGPDRRARYTGILRDRLAAHSPALAEGFAVADLEAVHGEMRALRSRLERMPG